LVQFQADRDVFGSAEVGAASGEGEQTLLSTEHEPHQVILLLLEYPFTYLLPWLSTDC
jgi:hypothetical protein